MNRWDDLCNEVFASAMSLDYTSVLGGDPYDISGAEQAKQWESLLASVASWQHVTTFVALGYCYAVAWD